MIVLGVDIESTSFDSTAEIVELGMVLYDTDRQFTINVYNRSLPVKEWSAEAEKIHRIPKTICDGASKIIHSPYEVIDAGRAEYIIAHNAEGDYKVVTALWPEFKQKEWLCSCYCLDHDSFLGRIGVSKKLSNLAMEYRIPVYDIHRAWIDAEICCKIASKHDLQKALEMKRTPTYNLSVGGEYIADYVEYVKSLHFKFDGEKRTWNKYMILEDEFQALFQAVSEDLPQWKIVYELIKKEY